jgi:hypothetical protein
MPRLQTHFGLADPRLQTVSMPMIMPVTIATTTAALTSPQAMSGLIISTNAAATTLTLPTASDLCNNIQGVMVGTSFEVMVKSTGAGGVTIAMGTGGTMSGTATVSTANIRTYMINFTNVTIGQEAYTVYSEGQAPY